MDEQAVERALTTLRRIGDDAVRLTEAITTDNPQRDVILARCWDIELAVQEARSFLKQTK